MDVLDSQIIGIGLDTLGYLAAAGLGMLVFSLFTNRRETVDEVSPPETVAIERPAPRISTTPMEFVSFQSNRQTNQTEYQPVSGAAAPVAHQARRDRGEILRMARQMVRAGTESKVIQRTLPVSDGELALMQSGS